MSVAFDEGWFVWFLHSWARGDKKRRRGLLIKVDLPKKEAILCPGFTDPSEFSEPIEFPADFADAPPGSEGIGIDHTTHLDLGDLAVLPFARLTISGRIPVPVTTLARVQKRTYELVGHALVQPPRRRGS